MPDSVAVGDQGLPGDRADDAVDGDVEEALHRLTPASVAGPKMPSTVTSTHKTLCAAHGLAVVARRTVTIDSAQVSWPGQAVDDEAVLCWNALTAASVSGPKMPSAAMRAVVAQQVLQRLDRGPCIGWAITGHGAREVGVMSCSLLTTTTCR